MNNNEQVKLPGVAGVLSGWPAAGKLLGALVLALLTGLACYYLGVKVLTALMISWDVFCLLMLTVSVIIFATARADQIGNLAWKNDENRVLIFVIVLVIVLISFVTIIALLGTENKSLVEPRLHVPISMIGVALSWFLLHTIFTNHYAHVFYGDSKDNPGENKGGLEFPGGEDPDYLDMAYFSFVIGMTFQVSDTTITSRTFRRLALLHGLISFLFNTVIVALTISLIAGLQH